MIVVDTNVISESMNKMPEPRVLDWLNTQALETLFLTAISIAELRVGVRLLPEGHRRDRLHENLEQRVLPLFTHRVLSFDLAATNEYAALISRAKAAGRSISAADGFIAAIASAHRMMVATRDTSPFEAAGLRTLNPWSA